MAFSSKQFFVDPQIDRAESLPATAFVHPEFLDLELGTIFAQTWQPVDLSDPIKTPGSRVPFELLGSPLFLQRDRHGKLHCFPNVCTHAWHALVESPSAGGAIICPQHGRQFDDQGRFASQAGFEKMSDFPRESDHLWSIHTAEWGPLVFVSQGDPLAPLQEFTANIDGSVQGIRLEELRRYHGESEVREVEGNWKQHAWNYMDNFHIRFVHKGPEGLADAIDMSSYRTELHRFSSLQWAYSRDPKNGFDHQFLAERFRDPKNPKRKVFALWWFIFPNITLNFYPWGLSINVYMPVPGKPGKTRFLWMQYALDEEKFQKRNTIWLSDQVDAEDIEAISLVNKGARSGFAPRGRFAPKEEEGPHWCHRVG